MSEQTEALEEQEPKEIKEVTMYEAVHGGYFKTKQAAKEADRKHELRQALTELINNKKNELKLGSNQAKENFISMVISNRSELKEILK